MTVNGKSEYISRQDLMEIAARYGIKGASGLIDRAADAARSYRKYGTEAGVPDKWIARIEDEIASRIDAL